MELYPVKANIKTSDNWVCTVQSTANNNNNRRREDYRTWTCSCERFPRLMGLILGDCGKGKEASLMSLN